MYLALPARGLEEHPKKSLSGNQEHRKPRNKFSVVGSNYARAAKGSERYRTLWAEIELPIGLEIIEHHTPGSGPIPTLGVLSEEQKCT